jgi:cyclopropane-fatty-acyl-phospholipid synthase
MINYKKIVKELLSHADIKIDGSRPWDIQVHNDGFYKRLVKEWSIGIGESYMDGWWDCKRIDELVYRIIKTDLPSKIKINAKTVATILMAKILNLQSKVKSLEVIEKHYDLSPELYMSFLDPFNQYTCGYFKNTCDLNKAQENKLNLICKKLNLSSKDKVLDIGCGWGGFAKFAAEKYGCHVTGINIADEQVKYAREYCKNLPVKIVKSDYRDFKGSFDKVLVCGMIEHVGYKNYKALVSAVHRCLKDEGIFLLHTVGGNITDRTGNPWLDKYIFPNGMLPSLKQIGHSAEGLFVVEDVHNLGPNYDKTLMAWYRNFQKAWPDLKQRYDNRFKRTWDFYLLSCAGSFRARHMQLWQIVMTKPGREQPKCRLS